MSAAITVPEKLKTRSSDLSPICTALMGRGRRDDLDLLGFVT